MDSAGYVFVQLLVAGLSSVYVYQPFASGSTLVQTIPMGAPRCSAAGGLALSAAGELFASDDAHNRVDVFTAPVKAPVLARTIAVGCPSSLAVDSAGAGSLYVDAVFGGNTPEVDVFRPGQTVRRKPVRVIRSPAFCGSLAPTGIALNQKQLYVVDQGNCYSPSANSSVSEFHAWANGPAVQPIDRLTLDSCCNVYGSLEVGP